jgi:CRP/FNR family transcriptional regulator, cyclic AMP receptor protein
VDAVSAPPEILALTADMPARQLQPGEVLYGQGEDSVVEIAVFVDGALRVELDGVELASITVPGAFIGEIGALLNTGRSATVVASERSTVRLIGDPDTFFSTHPELALELARQLAGRLHRLLAYLADVRSQYADAEGHLTMVDAVLGQLASRPHLDIEPGSERSPDY